MKPKTDLPDIYDRFAVEFDVVIRNCVESDLPHLEWFGLYTEHREIICGVFEEQQSGRAEMLIADVGGFPAGQLWLDLTRKDSESVGVLWAFRVFPIFQSRGIGKHLIEVAEQVLLARGYFWAEIALDKRFPRALPLYLRLGYSPIESVQEEFSYTNSTGAPMDAGVDLLLLRKKISDRPYPAGR